MSTAHSSTVGEEKRTNGALHYGDVQAFVNATASVSTPRPPTTVRVVAINKGPFVGAPAALEHLGAPGDATILDVRPAKKHAAGHVHGAFNVPVSGSSFATRAGFVLDPDERIELGNPAAERLLRSPTSTGRRLAEVAGDPELIELARAAREGHPSVQVVELRPTGSAPRRWVQVAATPLPDRKRALVLLQDVTDLRRAEAARRDFVANVSHELRTPVAALKALVETLEAGALDDPPAARDFLRRLHDEVEELAALVRELLGDPGRRKVSLRATDERVDVSAIARTQGGGGHRQAAGFTTEMAWGELVDLLRREVAAQLRPA
jgi:signal transduction histidine kinase